MAEAARQHPTLDDWLAHSDGSDRRWELIDGRLVALAPASNRHGSIAQNIGSVIEAAMGGQPPCRAVQGAGLSAEVGADRRGYVAGVVLTCEPADDDQLLHAPKLIVEILSPSTSGFDKRRKVPDYSHLASVEEIWPVDSRERMVLVWQRREGTWVGSFPHTGEDVFFSPVLAAEVRLDRLYRNAGL